MRKFPCAYKKYTCVTELYYVRKQNRREHVDATKLTEAQLVDHLGDFAKDLEISLLGTEVRLGAFRFDAIGRDKSGCIVVIELKVNAWVGTLGQLLVYPHAVRSFMRDNGFPEQPVCSLLITTHLDQNVVEVTERLASAATVRLKVCVGDETRGLRLVDPTEAEAQVWNQAYATSKCDLRGSQGKLYVDVRSPVA